MQTIEISFRRYDSTHHSTLNYRRRGKLTWEVDVQNSKLNLKDVSFSN